MRRTINNISEKIRNIFNSEDVDYTNIPLRRAILYLSVPMVLEMIMESTFAVVDIFFVAKLGADAIATVGITESLMTILYSVAIGLGIGTTAIVARRIGEKQPDKAAHYAWQAIVAGTIIALTIGIIGGLFSKELLQLMGANENIITNHSRFTTIMFSTNLVIILLFINNAIFRGAGDAIISMKVLWLANGVNIILDPIFIFGFGPIPAFGVEGAAIATSSGRALAVLWQFWILFNGKARVKLKFNKLKVVLKDMWHVMELSLGGMFQMLIPHVAWVTMVRIVSQFGSEVVAGYTLAIRILIFSLLPSLGISNAASTLVGQNLGAGKPERAEKSVKIIALVNAILMAIVTILFLFVPHYLIEIFTESPNVVQFGADCLRITGYGLIAYGVGMVAVQAFNGAGDTRTPTVINLVAFWVIEIPIAYLFAVGLSFGPTGVYYAILLSETAMTLTVVLYFLRGKWKNAKA